MPKNEKKLHLVTVRVSEATLQKIEKRADAEERTRSDVVRRLVEKSLRGAKG